MSNLLSQASLVMIPSGYKEDVVYSAIPTNGNGDLSFTRASNGTRVNSAGLVEVCPWNLADNSNDFGGLVLITKTTGQVSPIDSTSGNLLTATGSGEHYSGTASLTVVVGNSYTYSVYGKFVQGINLALRTVFSNGYEDISTIWNLSTGALVSNAGQHTNPTITAVGNGYYRCSITYTPSVVPAFPLLFRLQMAVGTNLSFTASSGDGFLAYGAQINNGALAPYFPTTDRLNVPRLTYQNGGGGCPSLLLEKQSTNHILYSEDYSQTAWTTTGTAITTNSIISPDGTQNADLMTTNDAAGSVYRMYEANLSGSDAVCTTSVYFKYGNWQYVFIVGDNYSGSARYAVFDLINITNTFVSSGYTATITSVGNGWYKCTLTGEMKSDTYNQFGLAPTSTTYFNISIANGKTLYIWGTQREQSSYETSYIPSTSSSATRVADLAVKSSISSLFGASATSLFMDFEITQASSVQKFTVTGYDGSYLFSLCQFDDINNYPRIVFEGGVDTTLGTALSIGRHKIAISFATNDFRAYIDGTLVLTDTSCTYNQYDRIAVNGAAWTGNTNNVNSFKLNQYAQFPNVLTNAELASLTTI